jgi:hypothetical protein
LANIIVILSTLNSLTFISQPKATKIEAFWLNVFFIVGLWQT